MAKIEFVHQDDDDHLLALTQTIEVRVWGLGGTAQQPFYIGSGLNFSANANYWLEIIYSVEGAQIFYTRNFLHHYSYRPENILSLESRLEELVQRGEGKLRFGYVLPETSLLQTLEKYTYEDENGEEKQSSSCKLEISADTGAVFARLPPGEQSVDIRFDDIELEDGVRFMHEGPHYDRFAHLRTDRLDHRTGPDSGPHHAQAAAVAAF